MISVTPNDLNPVQTQAYLQGAVGPRPIALASTVDAQGNANLSPFSFFNVFSSNPPVLVFSPARRVRNNTTKHTLENAIAIQEVVINVVNFDMVQQQSLASTEYAEGVDEFVKSGFTKLKSDVVQPWRVAESPVQFECRVQQIIPLGTEGGAGNLIICEVVRIHISEEILDDKGNIDQDKIDLVARMGGNWYTRASKGLFEVEKPLATLGLGVDIIPEKALNSGMFSGNDLGILGNVEQLPSKEIIDAFTDANQITFLSENRTEYYSKAKELIVQGNLNEAWKWILAADRV